MRYDYEHENLRNLPLAVAGFEHVVWVHTDCLVVDGTGHERLRVQRGGLGSLRYKSTQSAFEPITPYLVEGSTYRVRAGIPRKSWVDEKGARHGEHWETLSGALSHGRSDRVIVTDHIFEKPVAEFPRNRARNDGLSVYCFPCTRLYANTYYSTKAYDRLVSKSYGLRRGEYVEKLAEQGGVCAICDERETAKFRSVVKRLAVDHDHTTGKARGLLCHACNSIIGYAQDDKKRLQRAIEYLERYGN